MLKIGLLGFDKLALSHIDVVQKLPDCELIGYYEPAQSISLHSKTIRSIRKFADFESFINAIDVVDVIDNSKEMFRYASYALKRFKHIFLNKAILGNLEDANYLINLSKEANVKMQLAESARFDQTFMMASSFVQQPFLIECVRNTNDIVGKSHVVHDLMIKDLELILSLTGSPVKKINAHGFNTVNGSIDLASVKLEFDNGCIANLSASTVAENEVVSTIIHQRNQQIQIDYLNQSVKLINIGQKTQGKSEHLINSSLNNTNNAGFEKEFLSFISSIETKAETNITIEESYQALELSNLIVSKINLAANNL